MIAGIEHGCIIVTRSFELREDYMYLTRCCFPSCDAEFDYILGVKRTCYDSYYPFRILARSEPIVLEFDKITFLSGGNGSGKSTALNVIAEKLGMARDTLYNRGAFFNDYVELCKCDTSFEKPIDSRIITSDDVFDYMLNLRTLNEGMDLKREELFDEYLSAKYSKFRVESIKDYEQLKKVNLARSNTQSKYIKRNLMINIRENSNGESAFKYFSEKIGENGLYLLDEPENSLSPDRELELVKLIEDSARFFGCQFVIATHSPFLLSMRGAKIYNLDEDPITVNKWTELANVRTYYEFFKQKESAFET